MRYTKQALIGLTMLAGVTSSTAFAETPNAPLIEMIKVGMSDEVIIQSVRNDPKTVDHSATALIALKKAGASDAVLAAVASSGSASTSVSPSYPAMPAGMAGMNGMMMGGGGVIMIDGKTQTNLTLSAIRYRPGMMRLMTGFTLGKAIAEIKSGPSPIRSTSHRPTFQVTLGVSDAPQNSYGIVPMTGSGKSLKFDYHSVLNQSKSKLIPVTYKKISQNQFMNSWLMIPEVDLPSGEYVVLSGQEARMQPYQFAVN